jgi:hypothetical protein
MLLAIAVLMLVMWAVGLVTSVTFGGFLHLLVAGAIGIIALQMIKRRRVT